MKRSVKNSLMKRSEWFSDVIEKLSTSVSSKNHWDSCYKNYLEKINKRVIYIK